MIPLAMPAVRPNRDRFFITLSAVMLLIVLVGFTRTFFLHRLFGEPALPAHLYAHGIILTTWFCLAFVQTCLIATGRTAFHRRISVAGLFVAIAVVTINLVTLGLRDAPFVDEDPGRAFANLNTVVGFAILITFGVLMRRRSATHKRLMIFASLQIVLPAIDRIGRIPPIYGFSETFFAGFQMPPQVAFAVVGGVMLMLTVLAHDLYSERRIKLATLWALVSVLIFAPIISTTLISTGIWPAFVRLFV